ncbi:hypothetical protein [Krasilnikovia cinnamomea]|uniref:hypothetical protein n=1 Tax=Krasilnikovia cinnamomea TaxID=349313 RepID=UPI00102C800A|nr:hypothetical protein [Krasilnikovia cinnamomea]
MPNWSPTGPWPDSRQFPVEECERAATWVKDRFAELGFDKMQLLTTADGSRAVLRLIVEGLMGVEEPLTPMHAPNESVDPAEIERMALAEALFLQRYATT